MSSRQRGRAFIDRNKAGILVTPANSSSGTSRPETHKFIPSLRSHYVDCTDMSKTVKSHATRTHIGWADTQGRRGNMEDQIVVYGHDKFDLVAVFDGHNGPDVSRWAGHKIGEIFERLIETNVEPAQALEQAFAETNESIRSNNVVGGSTGLAAVVMEDDILVANVGDCRMIVWKEESAHRITKDHKPNDEVERARIEGLGGEVTSTELPNGTVTYRVNGILAVARAFGDFQLEPFITAAPDVFHTNISGDEEYIVIACDGLWDVLKDHEVVQICNAYWRDVKDNTDLEGAAGRLRNTAYSRHSTDNISVVVLKRAPPPVYSMDSDSDDDDSDSDDSDRDNKGESVTQENEKESTTTDVNNNEAKSSVEKSEGNDDGREKNYSDSDSDSGSDSDNKDGGDDTGTSGHNGGDHHTNS